MWCWQLGKLERRSYDRLVGTYRQLRLSNQRIAESATRQHESKCVDQSNHWLGKQYPDHGGHGQAKTDRCPLWQ